MSFLDLARKRYSVRAYKPDPIEEEKLQKVLEAVRLAPSASNRQPLQLIVVHTKGREAELNQICRPAWFVQAPLLICAVGLKDRCWVRRDGRAYLDVDIGIAVDHLTLAAADLGLGTCWVGMFYPDVARQVLGIPVEVEPIAFTPLGYPADQPGEKIRKPLSEIVRYERW